MLPEPSQTFSQTGNQALKYINQLGSLSFKPPQFDSYLMATLVMAVGEEVLLNCTFLKEVRSKKLLTCQ